MACDEAVIQDMSYEERAMYLKTLVLCSTNQHKNLSSPLAFGEIGLKERLDVMLDYKKPSLKWKYTAGLICLIVALCFGTSSLWNYRMTVKETEKHLEQEFQNNFLAQKSAVRIITDKLDELRNADSKEKIESSSDSLIESVSHYKALYYWEKGLFASESDNGFAGIFERDNLIFTTIRVLLTEDIENENIEDIEDFEYKIELLYQLWSRLGEIYSTVEEENPQTVTRQKLLDALRDSELFYIYNRFC